jgi:ABC-type branched-subunit amino acid transport system permease subunit
MIIYGVILVLTVLYMPKGITGMFKARSARRARQEDRE